MFSSETRETRRIEFKVMAGPAEIQLVDIAALDAAKIAQTLISEAQRLEAKYSLFLADSVTSQINAAPTDQGIPIDQETAALLDVAQQAFDLSSGLFDVTSGVLRKLWSNTRSTIPDESEIAQTLELVGWNLIVRDRSTIRLARAGMRIDLGGIVKEYAVDRLVTLAQENGVKAALINLAGDMRCFGSQWQVGIRDPFSSAGVHSTISLNDGAVATSGDYERFIKIDGVPYSHLVNPKTGWPIKSFASVSVCSSTCSHAGILATTAMLMGVEDGRELLKQSGCVYVAIDQRD